MVVYEPCWTRIGTWMATERFRARYFYFREEVLKTFLTARKGSQDLTAGNNFLRWFGDPTNTKEALEQRKGRISYVIGWIYTFHVKHRGPSVGIGLLWGTGWVWNPTGADGQVQQSKETDLRTAIFLWGSVKLNSKNKAIKPVFCAFKQHWKAVNPAFSASHLGCTRVPLWGLCNILKSITNRKTV